MNDSTVWISPTEADYHGLSTQAKALLSDIMNGSHEGAHPVTSTDAEREALDARCIVSDGRHIWASCEIAHLVPSPAHPAVATPNLAQAFLNYARAMKRLCNVGTQDETGAADAIRDELDAAWHLLDDEVRELAMFAFKDASDTSPSSAPFFPVGARVRLASPSREAVAWVGTVVRVHRDGACRVVVTWDHDDTKRGYQPRSLERVGAGLPPGLPVPPGGYMQVGLGDEILAFAEGRKAVPYTPPRYDEVFAAGTAAMDDDELEPGESDDDCFACESCGQVFNLDLQYSSSGCNETGVGVSLCESCCCFVDSLLARKPEPGDQHPTQPTVMVNGVKRFKSNAIVRWLLDDGPFDMNRIAMRGFDVEDQRQFAQLIGYSVSGYQDLSYSTVIDDDEDSSDAPTSVDFRGGRDLLPNAPGEVDGSIIRVGDRICITRPASDEASKWRGTVMSADEGAMIVVSWDHVTSYCYYPSSALTVIESKLQEYAAPSTDAVRSRRRQS